MKVLDGHNDALLALWRAGAGPEGFLDGGVTRHLDLPRARAGGFAGGFFAVYVPGEGELADLVVDTADGWEIPPLDALDPIYAALVAADLIDLLFAIEAEAGGAVKIVRTAAELAECVLLAASAAAQAPASQTDVTKGASTVSTEQVNGEVVQVDGNNLLVKLTSGELKTFKVPEDRKFVVDGKDLSVHDLKPGTTLSATVKTTTTSITVRTRSAISGKVWFAGPPNMVILTLPNGENKQYEVKDDVKFVVEGKPATVFDLRKDMVVNVEKIVEAPDVEITTATAVTGHAPSVAHRLPSGSGAGRRAGSRASRCTGSSASRRATGRDRADEGSSSWMMWASIIVVLALVVVFGRKYVMPRS